MKSISNPSSLPILAIAVALAMPAAQAGESIGTSHDHAAHGGPGLWSPARPDSHAPITVMADHTHHAGEFMLSYRLMVMEMGGYLDGGDSLSSRDLFDRGFMVAPTGMETEMHMVGVMHAPTNWLTLMAMGGYSEKSMDHITRPGSMARMTRGRAFTNTVEGWSDLSVSGLFKVYDANSQRVHLTLGLSIPTGEDNELAYPMQFTTGTWDLLPGATWLWQAGCLSGGAQVNGRVHLDTNDRGYAYGDRVHGTTWLAWKIADWVSVSGRVAATWSDRIDGADRRITAIMAPPMDARNSGGTFLDLGLGLNLLAPRGPLQRNRLAVELVVPLYQDVNGLQMEREWMLTAGWQYAF